MMLVAVLACAGAPSTAGSSCKKENDEADYISHKKHIS